MMKKRLLIVAGLVTVALPAGLAQPSNAVSQGSPETEEVIRAVHEVGNAWARGDAAALERLISSDYIHTEITGTVQRRDEWFADLKSRPAGEVHELEFENIEVRLYRDVAVVTGRNIWRMGSLELPLRFTQVLTREDGLWQRSAIQVGLADLRRYFVLIAAGAATVTLLTVLLVFWLVSVVRRRSRSGPRYRGRVLDDAAIGSLTRESSLRPKPGPGGSAA